jgi:D5 N terminal like
MTAPKIEPSPAPTQERCAAEIITFPQPPHGPLSEDHLRWWVAHPQEAAAEGIKPWQLEAIAYRLKVLAEIAERDRLDPEPVLPPPTDDEIEAALRKDGRPEALRHLEKLGPKPWKRKPATDVIRRDDAKPTPIKRGSRGSPEPTDDQLADIFAEQHHNDLRYVAAWGKWFEWRDGCWREEKTLRAFDLIRKTCKAQGVERASMAKMVGSVHTLARTDRRLSATIEQWDTDPMLLNTPDGVVDLRTGDLRPHRPSDYMT